MRSNEQGDGRIGRGSGKKGYVSKNDGPDCDGPDFVGSPSASNDNIL